MTFVLVGWAVLAGWQMQIDCHCHCPTVSFAFFLFFSFTCLLLSESRNLGRCLLLA